MKSICTLSILTILSSSASAYDPYGYNAPQGSMTGQSYAQHSQMQMQQWQNQTQQWSNSNSAIMQSWTQPQQPGYSSNTYPPASGYRPYGR